LGVTDLLIYGIRLRTADDDRAARSRLDGRLSDAFTHRAGAGHPACLLIALPGGLVSFGSLRMILQIAWKFLRFGLLVARYQVLVA